MLGQQAKLACFISSPVLAQKTKQGLSPAMVIKNSTVLHFSTATFLQVQVFRKKVQGHSQKGYCRLQPIWEEWGAHEKNKGKMKGAFRALWCSKSGSPSGHGANVMRYSFSKG